MNERIMKDLDNTWGTNNRQLVDFIYIESVHSTVAEDKDLFDRVMRLKQHTMEVYNDDKATFDFTAEHGYTGREQNFYMSNGVYKTGKLLTKVTGKGNMESYSFLTSMLHELGHVIDYRKVGVETFNDPSEEGILRKEIMAWVYGLKFGLLFGYISKQEIEDTFFECMLCLMTYFQYYGTKWEFTQAVNKIKKEIEEF